MFLKLDFLNPYRRAAVGIFFNNNTSKKTKAMIYLNKSHCLLAFVLFVWTISLSAQTIVEPQSKDLIMHQQEGPLRPLTIPPLEERDVSWESRVWREIVLKELQNHHFVEEKRPFISLLTEAALNGDIQAYSNIDDAFTTPLTVDDFEKLFYSIDTVFCCFGCDDLFDGNISVIRNEMNPADVFSYRIKEVWYYDENLGRMDVRILGIAPIVSKFDDNGNFLAAMPMCWFHYDEIRDYLAQVKAPNPNNDNSQMSWDDVFMSRNFSSRIIKQSNNRDLNLDKTRTELDVLLEANNIHADIFSMEQDVFSY
jgi:gliding motility associated protien GldN